MTKIVFYSYNGTHVPTLAALALAKPKHVEILWYVQIPKGSYEEFPDAVNAIQQFDFQTSSVTICPVTGDWSESALSRKPDAILLPTVRLITNPVETLSKLSQRCPLFLHEYGNTLKSISAFDLFPERHTYFRTIFTHGRLYHEQGKYLKTEKVMTGASKSDFYTVPYKFSRPTNKPFLVYCNTVSHVEIYDNRMSQPDIWIPILLDTCNNLDFELLIKLHPNTLFLYKNEPWFKNRVYQNSSSADLFRQSSGIISDPSSVLAEALLANKPIFTPRTKMPHWKTLDLILSGSYMLEDDPKKNFKIIRDALLHDALSKKRKELASLWWHNPDGHASQRIWKELLRRIH